MSQLTAFVSSVPVALSNSASGSSSFVDQAGSTRDVHTPFPHRRHVATKRRHSTAIPAPSTLDISTGSRFNVHCNEVYGPASPGQVKRAVESYTSNTNDKKVLPPYRVIQAPHLSEYISDLPSYVSPLVGERAQKTFTNTGEMVLADIALDENNPSHTVEELIAYKKAGPREKIVFGRGIRAAIVTCGGICPGINTVIREITTCLTQYGASKIFGVPHGYRGFYSGRWRELTLDDVEEKHKIGGSMLGNSRGGFDLEKIVDAIETRNIDHVYIIGGDGTIIGCKKIYDEIRRRGLKIAVVSVPKTIDNDIAIIDRSFGMFF